MEGKIEEKKETKVNVLAILFWFLIASSILTVNLDFTLKNNIPFLIVGFFALIVGLGFIF